MVPWWVQHGKTNSGRGKSGRSTNRWSVQYSKKVDARSKHSAILAPWWVHYSKKKLTGRVVRIKHVPMLYTARQKSLVGGITQKAWVHHVSSIRSAVILQRARIMTFQGGGGVLWRMLASAPHNAYMHSACTAGRRVECGLWVVAPPPLTVRIPDGAIAHTNSKRFWFDSLFNWTYTFSNEFFDAYVWYIIGSLLKNSIWQHIF
jgi:hypothetical protein